MRIAVIEGANRIMRGNGADVGDLHVIRDEDAHTFSSAWKPTDSELLALVDGGSVIVTFWQDSHPPIYVGVSS